MATATVEISSVDLKSTGAIYGRCIFSEALVVSGSTAPGTAVTSAELASGGGILVARVSADVSTYFAVGTSPDPTATAASAATTARRWLQAGTELPVIIGVGESVAVKAGP